MTALLHACDWSQSPLGEPAQWSPSLKTVMTLMLSTQAQIVLFWGPEYVALYNEAYAPSIGAKHPHALGRPAIEHWTELWDDLEPLLRGVRETGETFSAKDRPFYIERRGYGEQVFFDVSYSAVREADGAVGGVLCIVTETTERVLFERRQAFILALGQAVREARSAAQIEQIVVRRLAEQLGADRVFYARDNAGEASFDILCDYCPRQASTEAGALPYAGFATTLLGDLQAGVTVSQPGLFVPILRNGNLVEFVAVLRNQSSHFAAHEILLVEDSTRLVWMAMNHARAEAAVHARSVELRELNQQLEERVVAMVSEREASVAQLHEARKMKMVGQLTGGIAHDFNNLLTPIMASLELLQRGSPDARSARLIEGALQSADRARVLVGRLLTFARRQALKPQAIELGELVGSLRQLIQHSLGPMGEMQLDIPVTLPRVLVDPHQLELALLNLAVNARDAMDDDGKLRISACQEWIRERQHGLQAGRYVRVEVADSGCGMSAEVLSRCVEPFYTTKGVGKGTGLGLSMVQGLVVQSGGGFEIASAPGEGTVISLWLPVAEKWSSAPGSEEVAMSAPATITQVLLVDDEELIRQTTTLQLQELGYQVTACVSAAAALEAIDAGLVPDILVTDYIMAERSGAQLAADLRERFHDLPVLIVTGYTDLNPQQLSRFEVLGKPYRRAELANSIARLLPRQYSTPDSP